MNSIKYFAWEEGFSGPVASIWHQLKTDGNGKIKGTIGTPIALDGDDDRTIDELKLAYPIEAK